MRRNCNLELRLVPPTASDLLHSSDYNSHHQQQQQPMVGVFRNTESITEEKQLTIFYKGRVSVCDATELQARAIIMLASREMEEKLKSPTSWEPSSPLLQSQLCSPTALSVKRSLQQFLQKRKNRIQAVSPY
ncbi:protein TIFY 5A-like [Cornus florida]|uniref:protein TIFY 5A-like n=1 Tax=Cornus florida TaxID=4283 RepID=UPI0028A2019E|nr:protein TIFY 5A-like [Cornus florida]